MKGLVLATLAALVACTIGVPSVVRYAVDKEYKQKVGLQSYKFMNCLPADKEIAVVNSLKLMPDPLVFPGPLNVSFDVTVKSTVQSPVKTVVYLAKKVASVWVKIPCIDNVGSCTYDDLCQILSGVSECPDAFVKAGVHCNCPYNKKDYKMPGASFNVEVSVFPPGDYHGQANLTMNGQIVGCYDIMATFQ